MSEDKTTPGAAAEATPGTSAAGSGAEPSRIEALRGLAGTVGEGVGAVASRLPRPRIAMPKLRKPAMKAAMPGPGTSESAAEGGSVETARSTRLPGWAARALDRVPTTGLLALSAVVIWGIVFFNYWR